MLKYQAQMKQLQELEQENIISDVERTLVGKYLPLFMNRMDP